ncbi:hypothetical protein F2Q69_00016948 [Brassica cretica]|uniref:Uncharacterized protein n=1 Tax=Brassica cretica TaxID=69181 RepID=A0A8S9QQX2_BRACR|nr:hypothetical protein F2Q69_00016948 [Brassica cretica]
MMALTIHLREPRSKRRRGQGYIAEHPNDEEEVEGIDLHQQRYPWEGSDMDYLYDELAPFDQTKKKKKTFIVQDAIEDSAKSHGRHTICCLIVQEEFIGYIAEHPNDEEEVEGIDMHQQCYPWEGSGMDYLYDEVSISLDGLRSIFGSRRFYCQWNMVLYFMFQMLTQAPMLILSFNMPKSQCSGC